MKASKYLVLAAVAVMVAAMALVGCSSGGSTSAASASASGSASASAASASASSASASASSESASAASASAASASASAGSAAAAGEYTLIESGKLIVATSPDYPPFENLENGEYVGLDIEIAKAIGKELGLEVEFKNLEFNGIVPAIAAGGQADMAISGITIDPERAKEVDFSTSYYTDDQAIAAMKSGAITADNADAELDKEGVVIAVQSGTSGEAYVQEHYKNATAQPFGNSTDAFAAMQSGNANAVCTNKAVVEKMLADAYQDAVVVKAIATGEDYGIAVSKDNPELTKAIDSALANMKANGTIDALLAQYM